MNLDSLPPLMFRNPATTNWPYYEELIKKDRSMWNDTRFPVTTKDIDKLANTVQETLLKAFEVASPIKKHKAGRSVPYYTQEDKNQRRLVRRKFNACKKTGKWEEYYEQLRIYNKNLRIRERTGWKNHCIAIGNVHNAAKMYKILSKDPTVKVGSMLLPNREYTKTQNESFECLLQLHFPDSKLLPTTKQREL